MAEGGAKDVVLDDRNGSFHNQSEEASTSKRSSRRAPQGNRTTGITEHQQAEKRRRKLCDFLVLPLIGSKKNRFNRPKQHPRHRPQPR